MKRGPKITQSELLAANEKAKFDWDKLATVTGSRDRLLRPPAASITIDDYAVKRGVSRAIADGTLRAAAGRGAMKMKKFWNPNSQRWLSYFWFDNAAPKKH